jgi:UrcA family protein
MPQIAPAEPRGTPTAVRIAVTDVELEEPRAVARLKRRIWIATGAICEWGGVTAIHESARRRCRDEAMADATRQLEARIGSRGAASGSR